ncbi:hypothetical protein IAQ61_004678 [Plenodomus lingam]|uniref:CFEM domain-containing protein n=1 Tax=Leptosphaeria maculans (strain JN3 / isolate v23.1.3 / race Av1-4-5-6-7-8) TaxID=985895 RepID=E4ZW72_LEPMJ|nr:hypothetical protein LEMA_P030000.1 [Plenodomus lingam JN3]KAH9874050.1 hypothetical protein IAQ61_004678 [Plenodomus lingam]CBX95848.1 hypothetical protein LEMA_P030000.1 [Plenodomus lingam JN3]
MKFTNTITTITLLATSVLAQTACDPAASAIPTCGLPCISSAASAVGCTDGDYRCRCTSSDAIQSSAINCVIGNCGIPGALEVQASGSAVCACVATAPAKVMAVPTAF